MPPKPLSAGYFDGWYADQAAMPTVAEIMNRFPACMRAGVLTCWEPFDRADERLSARLRRVRRRFGTPQARSEVGTAGSGYPAGSGRSQADSEWSDAFMSGLPPDDQDPQP